MKEKLKKEKGITLIALIITIIVMLILVGVTVTTALNGNLFRIAYDAAKRTEEFRDMELELSQGLINGKPIEDLAGGVNFSAAFMAGQTAPEDEKGNYPQVGDIVVINPLLLLADSNIRDDDDMGMEMTQYSSSDIKVDLLANNSISYPILEGTGTITPVMNIIQNNSVSIKLKGATGFLNARDVLDKVCEFRYTNDYIRTARALRVEDIQQYIGQATESGNSSYSTDTTHYYPSKDGTNNIAIGTSMPEQTYKEYNMNNFTGHENIKKALFGGFGTSEHYSSTLGTTSVKYENDGKVGFYISCIEDRKNSREKIVLIR